MKDIARELSTGFRYVRVDLYEFRAKPSFGELTFGRGQETMILKESKCLEKC